MRNASRLFASALLLFTPAFLVGAEDGQTRTPSELFKAALQKTASLIEPSQGRGPQSCAARFDIVKAEGLPKELSGRSASLALQAPDRLLVSAEYKGKTY